MFRVSTHNVYSHLSRLRAIRARITGGLTTWGTMQKVFGLMMVAALVWAAPVMAFGTYRAGSVVLDQGTRSPECWMLWVSRRTRSR